MSSFYCPANYTSLSDLAEQGFALKGSVLSIDRDKMALKLLINDAWGINLPMKIPVNETPVTLNQPFEFQIQDTPWSRLGEEPVQMFRDSRPFGDLEISQEVILAPHLELWGIDDHESPSALDQPYNLCFEILPADEHQQWKFGLYFRKNALTNWLSQEAAEALLTKLEDIDLQELIFDALHKRQLLTGQLLIKLERATQTYVLDKIKEKFSPSEFDTIFSDLNQAFSNNWHEPEFSIFYNWLHGLLLRQHVTLSQSLNMLKHLSNDNAAQRKFLYQHISHILWLTEKETINEEDIQNEIFLNQVIQYFQYTDEGFCFDSYGFKKYYQTLSQKLKHDFILQLGGEINSNLIAHKSASKIDLDLFYFVFKMLEEEPFFNSLPLFRQVDILSIIPQQDMANTRALLMSAGNAFIQQFPQYKSDIITVIKPLIENEAVFQPDVIMSVGPESIDQMHLRWDQTLEKFKKNLDN